MFIMITMFGLSLWLIKLTNNFYQIQPGKRSYMAPTLVIASVSVAYNLGIAAYLLLKWSKTRVSKYNIGSENYTIKTNQTCN